MLSTSDRQINRNKVSKFGLRSKEGDFGLGISDCGLRFADAIWIDYDTGEVFSEWWIGRFWGASGKIRNEKMYYTTNKVGVRLLRKWLDRNMGKKRFSGLWLMWKPELRERLGNVCKELDWSGMSKQDDWDIVVSEIRQF